MYLAEETHLKVAAFVIIIFSIHVIGTRKHKELFQYNWLNFWHDLEIAYFY